VRIVTLSFELQSNCLAQFGLYFSRLVFSPYWIVQDCNSFFSQCRVDEFVSGNAIRAKVASVVQFNHAHDVKILLVADYEIHVFLADFSKRPHRLDLVQAGVRRNQVCKSDFPLDQLFPRHNAVEIK